MTCLLKNAHYYDSFGIMKGRFRVLKTGISLHGIEATDKIWKTCCALHNFLLEEDEGDKAWEVSNYLGADGHHDHADVMNYLGATSQENVNRGRSEFDSSGMGAGTDVGGVQSTPLPAVQEPEVENDVPGPTQVCKMDLPSFKSKLINHFDIMWKRGLLELPSRNGTNPQPRQILSTNAVDNW